MITREEYSELKELHNDGYRWIARDSCDCIYAYKLEPIKIDFRWKYYKNKMIATCGDDFLLPYVYVKWEDVKPTSIVDLIRDYESHQEITGGNNVNKAELIKEIKECPFCGSPYANKPVVVSYYNSYSGTQYFVRCTNCDATSCHTGTEEEAIRKWNLRSAKEVE